MHIISKSSVFTDTYKNPGRACQPGSGQQSADNASSWSMQHAVWVVIWTCNSCHYVNSTTAVATAATLISHITYTHRPRRPGSHIAHIHTDKCQNRETNPRCWDMTSFIHSVSQTRTHTCRLTHQSYHIHWQAFRQAYIQTHNRPVSQDQTQSWQELVHSIIAQSTKLCLWRN